jgi:hypothetical protein
MWSYDRCPNGHDPESKFMLWQEHVLAKTLYSLSLTILPYELPLIAAALCYYLVTTYVKNPLEKAFRRSSIKPYVVCLGIIILAVVYYSGLLV